MSRRPIAPPLPVDEALPELQRALAEAGSAVLVAPPGAGKTTRVPLALLDAGWLDGRRIVMLEPRRMAARAAAAQMARLLGERVGDTVGYRVRLDTRVGPRTRIEVVTEGVLTRMLQSDPGLEGVGAVVLDEFHERSLTADLGLALTLHARRLLRPDLRVLVMSATLDPVPVQRLLGGAPAVRSEGRVFPIETRYHAPPGRRESTPWAIAAQVTEAVRSAVRDESGDLLVFLPGAGEIRRVAESLGSTDLGEGVEVIPLHGRLARELQDRALAPSPMGRRKVVLATSIAETSLTIEGVRVVIDSGWMRVPRFDPGSGLTRLDTVRVSRDAADQRRGRAGRTAPGACVRLWSEDEHRGLVEARLPEVRDADLAPLLLDLGVFGASVDELEWLDAPPKTALVQAAELLRSLDLVDARGGVTDDGRAAARLGVHPRIGHMLVRARGAGRGGVACDLAALLGERDLLRADGRAPAVDARLRLEALRRASGPGLRGHRVDRGSRGRVLREAEHLRRRLGVEGDDGLPIEEAVAAVAPLLAWAYPDRVGLRRDGARGRFLLRNGRGVRMFDDDPLAEAEAIVVADLDDGGREARIHLAAPLDREALERQFADRIEQAESVAFDPSSGRVRTLRIRRLGALELEASSIHRPDPHAVAEALCDGVRSAGLPSLPWTRETRQFVDRVRFLHALEPEPWPAMDDASLLDALEDWLAPFLTGMRSLDDLRRVDLAAALSTRVGWERGRRLDDEAPTHFEVPSGSRIALDYSDPRAPVLAVRLQEVFGLLETPRIGGGRVPLTVHLLSPASRPVQVTTDLASFWRTTYFEVRKDLRGRYPKHAWPEDPLTATALRGVPRRGQR